MSSKFPTTSNALWGTGPTTFYESSPVEAMQHVSMPGVNGTILLKMGNRKRPHRMVGTLITSSITSLQTLWTNIQNNIGSTGYMKDDNSAVHSNVTLSMCDRRGPIQQGGGKYYQHYFAVFERSGG